MTDLSDELEELRSRMRGAEWWIRNEDRERMLSRLGAGAGGGRVGLGGMPRRPVGDSPAQETLGNTQPWVGQANILSDPTFEGYAAYPAQGIGAGPGASGVGYWKGHYTVNSGTAPSSAGFGLASYRAIEGEQNPSNTAAISMDMVFGANAANVDYYLYNATADDLDPATLPVLDFLMAGVRLFKAATITGFDVLNVRLELLEDGVVSTESIVWDYLTVPEFGTKLLSTSIYHTPSDMRSHTYRWRLRVHIEKGSGAASIANLLVVEPQLHFAPTPDLLPFQPAVANWKQGVIPDWFVLLKATSPAQITANQDNYTLGSFPNQSRVRLSSDASRNITGITRGREGNVLVLHNIGSFPIVLVHDATSTAANRFYCPGAIDFTLAQKQSVMIVYDDGSDRWYVLGSPGGGAPTPTAHTQLNTGDVTMTLANTYYDGASLSLAAGTYLITAGITILEQNSNLTEATAKLWDGTTVYVSGQATMAADATVHIQLSWPIVLAATTTVKISAATNDVVNTIKRAAPTNSAGNNATYIAALKVA